MQKTPEEIKKGLECHARPCGCDMGCPYVDVCREDEGCPMSADALALIQQLQAENTEKDQRIRQLEEERDVLDYTLAGVMHSVDKWLDVEPYKMDGPTGNDAVARAVLAREIALKAIELAQTERDAAVHDLKCNWKCASCKNFKEPVTKCPHYHECGLAYIHWQWRGVQT